jgi:hypothetical protein
MILAERRTGAGAIARGRMLAAVALFAAGLALVAAWPQQARAANNAGQSTVNETGEPIFGLPPIVVQIPGRGRAARTIVFKAALIFDEVDADRINDSQRLAKTLLPKIMDSVITGVQNHQFVDLTNTEEVNKVVLDRSTVVLKPYGVLLKGLRMEHLGVH